MRNFIIFFDEKEGTSSLVRLLDHFERISILHQVNNIGWEPFDRHHCGPMTLKNLERCLDSLFSQPAIDIQQVNRIYTRSARTPLEAISRKADAFGFKMRFRSPRDMSPYQGLLPRLCRISNRYADYHDRRFRPMMIDLLQRNDVVVFLAVRQDVLRWSLSKYHGDGTGKAGHLQFKLATGEIRRRDIRKIHVNCKRLEAIRAECEKSHAGKRRLQKELKRAGVQTHLLLYEDFLADKRQYFNHLLDCLGLDMEPRELDAVLRRGAYFEKVHADDISDFVENHQEVYAAFGDRYIPWR